MNRTCAPVNLAGRTLSDVRHVCAFFHSPEEREKIIMPFLKEGYEQGEKIFRIVDAPERSEQISECRKNGLEVSKNNSGGQVEVRVWEETYLKDGEFRVDRMLKTVSDVIESNRGEYPSSRLVGHMEWSCTGCPGVHDILEYEARLNDVIPKNREVVVCVYDLNKHSGSVVMDILRTHPLVIVGGILQENPLYVRPHEFLKELKARNANGASQAAE